MRGSDWRVAGSTQDAEGPGSATRCASGPGAQRHRRPAIRALAATGVGGPAERAPERQIDGDKQAPRTQPRLQPGTTVSAPIRPGSPAT